MKNRVFWERATTLNIICKMFPFVEKNIICADLFIIIIKKKLNICSLLGMLYRYIIHILVIIYIYIYFILFCPWFLICIELLLFLTENLYIYVYITFEYYIVFETFL